jgi:hypothetical protein
VAVRPADLNLIDVTYLPQAEMDASIVVGDIAAAAVSRADQRFTAGPEGDSRSDRVAVLARASKVEDEVIALAGRLVPEDDTVLMMMSDDQIEVSIAV